MRRAVLAGCVVVAGVAGCHRQPEPTFEYGETVTYTSTADDSTPRAVPPVRATGSAAPSPSANPPPSTTPAASATPPGEPSPSTVSDGDGEWTATVHTAAGSPSAAQAPAEPAAAPAPPASSAPAPNEPAAPPAPRQWYKAKPW